MRWQKGGGRAPCSTTCAALAPTTSCRALCWRLGWPQLRTCRSAAAGLRYGCACTAAYGGSPGWGGLSAPPPQPAVQAQYTSACVRYRSSICVTVLAVCFMNAPARNRPGRRVYPTWLVTASYSLSADTPCAISLANASSQDLLLLRPSMRLPRILCGEAKRGRALRHERPMCICNCAPTHRCTSSAMLLRFK